MKRCGWKLCGCWGIGLNQVRLDRVLGDYRVIEKRDASVAKRALDPQIDLLMAAPEPVRLEAIEVASRLGIAKIAGALASQVGNAEKGQFGSRKGSNGAGKIESQISDSVGSEGS